jgi:hypothetical protein
VKLVPRIDPTINVGHILTAIVMISGGMVVWSDGRTAREVQNHRLALLEQQSQATATTLSKLVENQAAIVATNAMIAKELEAFHRRAP